MTSTSLKCEVGVHGVDVW